MVSSREPLATTPGAQTGASVLQVIALVLLIVGGLNWALVGLFNFDLVAALFGPMSPVSRIVYVLVGIAALLAFTVFPRLKNKV